MINKLIKLADYLDANGAEEEAAKVDALIQTYAAEQASYSNKSLNVDDQDGEVKVTISYSSSKDGNTESKTESFDNLEDAMKAFDKLDSKDDDEESKHEDDADDKMLAKLMNDANKEEEMNSKASLMEKLVKLADYLDWKGDHDKAQEIDDMIRAYAVDQSEVLNPYDYSMDYRAENPKSEQSKRYDSQYHHSQTVKEPRKKQERIHQESYNRPSVATYGVTGHALSARHCPDHIGVGLKRVGENMWQCMLDGAVYNYEVGFKDQDGKQVPGGSVANQTPMASEYAIPSRLFDSREPVINKIN